MICNTYLANKSGRHLQRFSILSKTQALDVGVSCDSLRLGCGGDFLDPHVCGLVRSDSDKFVRHICATTCPWAFQQMQQLAISSVDERDPSLSVCSVMLTLMNTNK